MPCQTDNALHQNLLTQGAGFGRSPAQNSVLYTRSGSTVFLPSLPSPPGMAHDILKKAVARNGATTQRLKTKTYEDQISHPKGEATF
jgi:hypothetical protein